MSQVGSSTITTAKAGYTFTNMDAGPPGNCGNGKCLCMWPLNVLEGHIKLVLEAKLDVKHLPNLMWHKVASPRRGYWLETFGMGFWVNLMLKKWHVICDNDCITIQVSEQKCLLWGYDLSFVKNRQSSGNEYRNSIWIRNRWTPNTSDSI